MRLATTSDPTAPQISANVERTRAGFVVNLTTDKYARAVYLSAPGLDGAFVDNYFDLLPGKEKSFDAWEGMTLMATDQLDGTEYRFAAADGGRWRLRPGR